MPIHNKSRYRFSSILQVEISSGVVERFIDLRSTTIDPPTGSTIHAVRAGDTFESLARAYYGSGNKWYVIADANPQIFYPLDLTSGQKIVIPPRSYAELV